MSEPNNWNKIFLHWTATPRSWCQPNHYHSVVHIPPNATSPLLARLTPYDQPLYDATAFRNTNSISLALACMSPIGGTWSCPPTESQIDLLCKEVAKLCKDKKWDTEGLEHLVMTHAEAGGLRDYPRSLVERFSYPAISGSSANWDHHAQEAGLPHANYGPSSWEIEGGWPGGDVCRWDLAQLRPADKMGAGGHELRARIGEWMKKL